MVTDNEAHNKNHDKLRAANEEKKNKLIEQYGACFSDMSINNELPPEIESQFLDNILAFETNYDSTNCIPLYDFVGKPSYRKADDLSDKEITEELNRLTDCWIAIRLHWIPSVMYPIGNYTGLLPKNYFLKK